MRVSRLLAAVLGTALGLFPIAPPEHVHEREDHGHAHLTIHRHLNPHGILPHRTEHDSSVDDDDGPAVTLDTVYNVRTTVVIGAPERNVAGRIEPPPLRRIERPVADTSIQIHGPPRAPASLRAPPLSPTT